jgi:hypothetical protein
MGEVGQELLLFENCESQKSPLLAIAASTGKIYPQQVIYQEGGKECVIPIQDVSSERALSL